VVAQLIFQLCFLFLYLIKTIFSDLIKLVSAHSAQLVYTRVTKGDADDPTMMDEDKPASKQQEKAEKADKADKPPAKGGKKGAAAAAEAD
jgi:hypothetical protein